VEAFTRCGAKTEDSQQQIHTSTKLCVSNVQIQKLGGISLSGEMVRRSSILSLNDCKYPTHNATHRHFTNVLSLFTVPDIVCQLNDIEFTVDLFVDDDVNNDAIFKHWAL